MFKGGRRTADEWVGDLPRQARHARSPTGGFHVDLTALLRTLSENEGSDLHLKVGAPPIMRIDGELRRTDQPRLKPEDTERLAESIMPPERRPQLLGQREADFALTVPGVGRFRVNVFRQRGATSIVLRRVRIGSPSFDELGLPPVAQTLADAPRGLILVCGPTGAGKTTTLAAMIEHINQSRACHIVTLEDPIEVVHLDKLATVNQREIGVDTDNFVIAMRAVVRQDPDVILVGEMRDQETVQAALSAAETGHLVLSTLHTSDAVETVNRIVDFFPPWQHHQVRVTLASVLVGVLCQRLVPQVDGGRSPAVEVMVVTGRVADRIIDADKTSEIHSMIEEGKFYGMQTFDQSLLQLVAEDRVSIEEARLHASNPHDFALMLEQAGLVKYTA
jgi:twitching motility protein PilT